MSSAIHKNGSDRCRHVPAIDQGALVIALNLNQACCLIVKMPYTIPWYNDSAIFLTIESAVYYAQHLNALERDSSKNDLRADLRLLAYKKRDPEGLFFKS